MLVIHRNVSLADHCRFRVGGPADFFVEADGPKPLLAALRFARRHGLRRFVYGGGSNVLFDDAGFRGIVVRVHGGSYALDDPRCEVAVDAGYDLPALVRGLAEDGFGGIEFLGNIPGSVGGAVVGNAGCYGRAVADVLVSARLLDVETEAERVEGPAFFEFAYRNSRLKDDPGLVVLSATLKLARRPRGEVLREVEEELALRMGKHPHEARCAGSFFKNPSREMPAWRAITEAGLAEARVGDAMLSSMHANFLVNAGQATSADILALVSLIRSGVLKHSGIVLAPEVRYVGPTGFAPL